MNPIFKKLNLKEQKEIFVLNSPESFENNILELDTGLKVKHNVSQSDTIEFYIGFAEMQSDLRKMIEGSASQLEGDALYWLCYPKKSSKKFKSDITRDDGWEAIAQYNMEPVKLVSIDEDWSAMRFRKVEYIKVLNRNKKMIISKEGMEKAKKSK